MANYVLVAGARLGAWAWDDVVPFLRAAADGPHGVYPLTLSGLAERAERAGQAGQAERAVPDVSAIGQQTHVDDIVTEIERRDLRDVVLVGHSYAGVPVGQAAVRIGPERLRRVVFVDASVPVDGQPFVAEWADGGAAVRASIAAHDGYWPCAPASHFAGHDLSAAHVERLVARATPHPGATLTDPAVLPRPLTDLPATYILCRQSPDDELDDLTAELTTSPTWELTELTTGHWPMFSRPEALAGLLLAAAG